MKTSVTVKPVSEMTLKERLAFSQFMTEIITQLKQLEFETKRDYKKLPDGTHVNTLMILTELLQIYNSPDSDYIALQKMLQHLEDIANNPVFTQLYRTIADEMLKGFNSSLTELGLVKKA